MAPRSTSNTEFHARRVYKLLTTDYIEGRSPRTRSEIQRELYSEFTQGEWAAIMRLCNKWVNEKLNLTIPRATAENGFVYGITDDPNDVVPGLLLGLRQQSGLRKRTAQEREFIRRRSDRIDDRLNGKVLELADIVLETESLVMRTMGVVDDTLRDQMDERRDAIHGGDTAVIERYDDDSIDKAVDSFLDGLADMENADD